MVMMPSFLRAARGGKHLELEGEAHLADVVESARDVGIFTIERNVKIEAANALEAPARDHEVAALHHGTDAEDEAVERVGHVSHGVEDLDEHGLRGREIEVDQGAAKGRAWRGRASNSREHILDPALRQAGVGVDVGNQLAGGVIEAGLTGVGKAFARLVDQGYAGKTKGNFARAIGTGVVDDDKLGFDIQVPRPGPG